ncbi:hypothetical protein PENANT_c001G05978 [Penicillium antarcticum]|uniref:Uncharacterized protein n=1 Tax=Penicillium antarcticum TaxID=416450 RepID=A0A1V6QPV3_9EURO|nr:hypothetical protein PENANT_c001G05978 [Penicillium antarcticum]
MLRPVLRTQLAAPILSYQIPACRLSSTTSSAQHARGTTSDHALAKPHTIDPRWLTMIKRRIGKCMMFGLKPDQVDEGGKILQQLANDWRELIAGSEGFLTDKKRRSLFRHNVVWGEQPMTSPDKITVYQRLVPDPNSFLARQSAFQLQVLILSEAKQRPAARCHEDIVTYDYKKNQKTHNLPPFVKDQFKVIYELQEQAQKEWQQQVAEIENRVRTLELESWDRVDAIEDKGSS